MINIPQNWVLSTIGEVCTQPQYGYTTSGADSGNLHLLRTTDISKGDIDWETVPFCQENPADEEKYLLKDGDIVISRAGSIGVSHLIRNPQKSVFASYLIRFRPFITLSYFKYFLNSPFYWQQISENRLGIAVPNVNATKLQTISLPLPPTNEQKRIVAKIEELFSELDKGIENLKTAREQLKIYRQAVLKHAFEGKLTAHWREQNKDKLEAVDELISRIQRESENHYRQQLQEWEFALETWRLKEKKDRQPIKPKKQNEVVPITKEEAKELSPLPDRWEWVKLGQLVWSVKDGPHYSPPYEKSGIPFISGGNVRPNGIDFSTAKYISPALHEELSLRCKPELGDVLYTKGGTTGIARVNTYDFDFNVWVHVAVLKITESLEPFYLQHALNSNFCYVQSQKYTHGVGNQDLGLTRMVNIILPICGKPEQQQLIREIDTCNSVIDELEQIINAELQKSEALRQSILKKAFSGKLVAQDPNDEPASVLLERIRAEKEVQKTESKKPKAKGEAA